MSRRRRRRRRRRRSKKGRKEGRKEGEEEEEEEEFPVPASLELLEESASSIDSIMEM